jgi:hypothetical protein
MSNTKHSGMLLAGVNLAIMIGYTLITSYIKDGIILDGILILFHFLICLGLAIAKRSWLWVFSGLLVLLIGISTCVNLPWI